MSFVLTKYGYRIHKTPENEKKYFKKLSIRPKQTSKMAYNLKPKPVICYRKSEQYIYVPRYFGYKTFGKPIVKDEYKHTSINLEFKGEIRDYQQDIINKTLKNFKDDNLRGGFWDVSTGAGKTICALNLIYRLNVKTIVIVHKEFLMNQWIDRIQQFLPNAKIGKIQAKTIDTKDKDIVIGMLQSISLKDYEPDTFSDFTLLIVDECHSINSVQFSKALFKIQTKYKLGLSATPHRADGLDKVFEFHVGPKIIKIENCILDPTIHIYPLPRLKDVVVSSTYTGNTNMAKLITDISESNVRNEFIYEILEKYITEDRKIIIFSDRVNHCKTLQKKLSNLFPDINVNIFIGNMSTDEREKAIEADIIVCTYSIAKEGFDVKKLDTLLLATPKSDIVQVVGRILRQINKNKPIVIDLKDRQFDIFMGQFYKRKKFYKEKNYDIYNYNPKEDELQEDNYKKKSNTKSKFNKCKIVEDL